MAMRGVQVIFGSRVDNGAIREPRSRAGQSEPFFAVDESAWPGRAPTKSTERLIIGINNRFGRFNPSKSFHCHPVEADNKSN